MFINILVKWIICCFLITKTDQKSTTLQFRTLPLKSDKLTIAELPSYNLFEPYGPGTYAFGYEIEDTASNNIQFRDEEKLENGTVRGSYGLVRPNGLVSITRYFADNNGYHSSTQTFNQNYKKPTILTSTLPPFMEISSPSDVMFLDVPNPATISSIVVQHILEQNKVDLATPSSNIPITEIFSSPDDDNDAKTVNKSESYNTSELSSSSIQQLLPTHIPSHIPNLPVAGPIGIPIQTTNPDKKKVNELQDQNSLKPSSDEISNILKPPDSSELTNILGTLLPHIPKLPTSVATTKSPQSVSSTTAAENLSDEKLSSPSPSNIFGNIIQHIPQVSIPNNTVGVPIKEPISEHINNLSDVTEAEISPSSITTTTKKPSSSFPPITNILENFLPHLPHLPLPISMGSTTTILPSSTSSSNNLSDENETSENPTSLVQSSTTATTENKPISTVEGFPSLSQIFGFLNPANFPIFKPPTNTPNKQDGSSTSSTETSSSPAMDSIFDSTSPTIEPIFAIIHKNATVVPIYADDGTTIGIQLVNNIIPSNFHIIPFIIPSNYFHSSPNSEPAQQNIAHDEVSFEETVPNFVNDKFHDPLNDSDDDDTWKSEFSRKRKGGKRYKTRRNINSRRRFRNKN